MSFNALLLQLVLFSCVFSLIRSPRLPKGWRFTAIFILAVLVISFVVVPGWAGWISGGVWLVLMVIPLLGFLKVNRLFYQERYRQARQISVWIRWLHPADGWIEYPEILRGLELGQQGKWDEALRILDRHRTPSTSTGRIATMLLYRLEARWDELLDWIRQNWSEEKVFNDASIAIYYLRALGEVGDLNRLVQGLQTFEQQLEKSNDTVNLNLVRMFALAFCGQPQAVRQLFDGPLSVYSRNTRQFWIATADWAAGHEGVAQASLVALQHRCDLSTRHAIAWRFAHPCHVPVATLTPIAQHTLSQIRTVMGQESRYGGQSAFTRKQFYVTYLLIAVNVLVFGLEIALGGSENLDTLYRMGAMVPEDVLAGEWWRLLSATFLHYGFLHLFVNMLGLYVLGIFVEATLGVKKFLWVYFFSGIGSMAAIAALATVLGVHELIGVGASGAIMGLLGVMAAILLKGWRREKARIAARRLRLVALIVVLQVVSDVFTPQVSVIGHVSGLGLGFLAGLAIFTVGDLEPLD